MNGPTLQELEAELMRRESQASLEPSLESLEMELAKRGEPLEESVEEPKKKFNLSRFIGEQLAKGALGLADLFQAREESPFLFAPAMPEKAQSLRGERPRPLSEASEELGLDTQEAETPGMKVLGHGLRAAPAGLLSAFSGPAAIAASAARAGAAGLTSGALQEQAGVSPLAADVATLGLGIGAPIAAKAAGRAAKGALKKTLPTSLQQKVGLDKSGLTREQKEVAEVLQKYLPEEERLEALAALEKPKSFPKTGFVTSTAGETRSPVLSHLHRLQYEDMASQLPKFSETQTRKLNKHLRKSGAKTESFENNETIRKGIESRVGELKQKRQSAVEESYERLRKDKSEVKLKNLKKFLEENKNVAGKLRSDIEYIQKQTNPVLKAKDKAELKRWINARNAQKERIKEHGIDARKRIMTEWEKDHPRPEGYYPTVGRLVEAEKALTAQIEATAKVPSRKRLYVKAKEALSEDLAHTEDAATRNLYRELSAPISEIEKHPTLKKIAEKSHGHYTLPQKRIMNEIFNERSHENIVSLEKALGKDSATMESIRQGAMRHLYDKITTTKEIGKETVREISYPKLRNFMDTHNQALTNLLTPEQKKILLEVRKAARTQHSEKRTGEGINSATAGRLRSLDQLRREFKFENEKGLTLNPKTHLVKLARSKPSPATQYMEDWLNRRADTMMDILSEALMDKELAKKMLKTNFKSQVEFDRFMKKIVEDAEKSTKRSLIPAAALTAKDSSKQKERKD
jgi:hypothetical protein